jgi:hypothetical protein
MGIRAVGIAAVLAGAVVAGAVGTAACTVPVQGTPAPDTAAVSSAAPSPSPAPAPGAQESTYRDEQGRFAIVPPPGWPLEVQGRGKFAAAFVDPELSVSAGAQFRANVNVVVGPADGGLAGVVASTRLEYESLDRHRATADGPLTLSDGSPAHLLAGIVPEPTSGVVLQYLEVIAVHGGTEAVLVTGTALPGTWDRYGPVFETSLRSLTVAT